MLILKVLSKFYSIAHFLDYLWSKDTNIIVNCKRIITDFWQDRLIVIGPVLALGGYCPPCITEWNQEKKKYGKGRKEGKCRKWLYPPCHDPLRFLAKFDAAMDIPSLILLWISKINCLILSIPFSVSLMNILV